MKQFIKRYSGEIILTGGIGLFIYSIFNFSYETTIGSCLNLDLNLDSYNCDTEPIQGVAYYYQPDTILMISVGAMLIVIGILIIRK